jgi:hypothetical protein
MAPLSDIKGRPALKKVGRPFQTMPTHMLAAAMVRSRIPEAKVIAFVGHGIRPATVITLASHFPQSKEEEGLWTG